MAARDPVLEELRRNAAGEQEKKSNLVASTTYSTTSLEAVTNEDIDAIVNKKWHLEELLGPIRSQLVILSGGRDKRGAPVITVQPNDHSDVGPVNIGRIFAYLGKIPNSSLQGLGYTVILDSRQTSWAITKATLNSIQLTFVEHIFQVLVLKPKSFWKRQRVGVGLTLKKGKYNFSTYVLEAPVDLLQFLAASQITHELGGSLQYNHELWMETQRNLEKHIISLQGRKEDFDLIQEQLELEEDLQNLEDARDAVRRHVETRQRLEKADLDMACEAVSHTVSKYLPCQNPDFLSCFTFLEELCSLLQDTRNQLEQLWKQKGENLDKLLQIRLFESEVDKLREWMAEEISMLAREHTDIGDSLSVSRRKKTAFSEHRTELEVKYQQLSHTIEVGERLITAQHYARDQIKADSQELEEKWEKLRGVVEERVELLGLSVSFHECQDKFFQKLELWLDECLSKESPSDVTHAQEMLTKHEELKETCHALYTTVRTEGLKIVEKLRIPVGDSSLPTGFVVGTRHVKEILESLYDEKGMVDEQWANRHMVLSQELNLLLFQEEAKKVYSWLRDVGNPFLSTSNTIGKSESDTTDLLRQHNAFNSSTEDISTLTKDLQIRAEELARSQDCNPAVIKKEAGSLQEVYDRFILQLSERRQIIVEAGLCFRKIDESENFLQSLASPVSREVFDGLSDVLEVRLLDCQTERSRASEAVSSTHQQFQEVINRMQTASEFDKEVGGVVSYSGEWKWVEWRLEELKKEEQRVWSACDLRERRWNLSIQLNHFEPDVEKHITQLKSWIQEQESIEWEPAHNLTDSKSRLGTFQRQYNEINKSHVDLIATGQSIALEIDQLDSVIFGISDSTHPVVTRVDGVIARMVQALKKMECVAVPRLQQLKGCYLSHDIKQTSSKLSSSLTTLSVTLLHVLGLGETLEEAEELQSEVTKTEKTLEDIKEEVKEMESEVAVCIEYGVDQAADLEDMVKALRERCGSVELLVKEKLHIVSVSVDFHQNVQNLNSSMDACQDEFSSKEFGRTLSETKQLLKSMVEKRTFIEQAIEVVQSQGKKLQDILMHNRTSYSTTNGDDSDINVKVGGVRSDHSPRMVRKAQSTDDLADIIDELTDFTRSRSRTDSDTTSRLPSKDDQTSLDYITTEQNKKSTTFDQGDSLIPLAPNNLTLSSPIMNGRKLLVSPKRTRRGLKTAISVPNVSINNHDQQIIKNLLDKINNRLNQLILLWEGRKKGLEEAKKASDFREAVPQILEKIETVGEHFNQTYKYYGRSIQEVTELLKKCSEFEHSEVVELSERVRKLLALSSSLKGSSNVPELRALETTLQTRWDTFEREVRKVTANLELSLKFHKVLYEASTWIQTTQHLLNDIEVKVDEISKSDEAAALKAEMSVYHSATSDQQDARIEQLHHISNFLEDNHLSTMANQITENTQQTESEYDFCKANLEKIYADFLYEEGEKDRIKKVAKKRKHVMQELLETEEAYVNDLRLIVERFRPRFVSELLPNSLKGKEKIIFGNIHEIESFHRMFMLPRLQDHNGIVDDIASLFVECADEMISIYVPFCQGKMASEELLASHRTYLARVQSLFGIETPLSTLMIKPIQRITKYPLLLQDALKLTAQLGQSTRALEKAVLSTEKVLIATNNAIHICFLDNSKELIADLGDLLYQGLVTVSEAKFGIKAEKERQVFCFDHALLFSRKVEIPQTSNFKYEYKFKIPVTSKIQIVEFVEGEANKFLLVADDHRLQFKAPTLEEKQQWVKILRSATLATMNSNSNPTLVDKSISKVLLESDNLNIDLRPSPQHSPLPKKKETTIPVKKLNGNGAIPHPLNLSEEEAYGKYMVKEDYHPAPPQDILTLSLNQGDIVEVLDNSIDGKWFVRVQSGTEGVAHGWFPSDLLERVEKEEGEDEVDGKKAWIQITAGPLSGTSDEEKLRKMDKEKKAFGSHDIQRHHVINNLKKVTIALEGMDDQKVKEELNGEESSLDFSSLDKPSFRIHSESQTTPTHLEKPFVLPSLHGSPQGSPHHATLPHAFSLPSQDSFDSNKRQIGASFGSASMDAGTKGSKGSQFTRKTVIKVKSTKRGRSWRHNSVSSEQSEGGQSIEGEELTADKSENVEPESSLDLSPEKIAKAQVKMKYIINELIDTEKTYVAKLEELIKGYMSEMQSPNLPDALKGKEKIIFGNIKSLLAFHKEIFLEALEQGKESMDAVVQCFIDHAHHFELYVTYCENKPTSESFLWTYVHTGGTFFEDIQKTLGHKQGIDSLLIKPVQRMSMYKLLLRDIHNTAKKLGTVTSTLEKALQITQDVPKRANDAMTLSMIYDYDGNIHKHGQIILQDEFIVFERNKRAGTRRQLFLLDQRLIITKEKDADGLYVFKDSLKVHSLSVAEKEGDNPNRFAVGTGKTTGEWDQYYLLEAVSIEKKQEWIQALKDIVDGQFELLKALSSSNSKPRSKTLDATAKSLTLTDDSVAMINFSDDSEQEDSDSAISPCPSSATRGRSNTAFPFSPSHSFPSGAFFGQRSASIGESTPTTPSVASTRTLNLYVVAEDCAPPKDDEGIMYIHKGQIFDVLDNHSDWWLARLVRDVEPYEGKFCQQGWVPGSFLDRYEGQLEREEEAAIQTEYHRRNSKTKLPSGNKAPSTLAHLIPGNSYSLPLPSKKRKKKRKGDFKLRDKPSFDTYPEEEDQLSASEAKPKPPQVLTHLSDETVLAGRSVRFRCELNNCVYPLPTVEWRRNGALLTIDRAFASSGEESCVLRIKDVEVGDEGVYKCTISNQEGVAYSTAKLTVIGPPTPPHQLFVKPLSSTSVLLSWAIPTHTGHSPITHYLVECKDVISDRWSSLMMRIVETTTVINDLMPGSEYIFRVYAKNHIGMSEFSEESEKIKLSMTSLRVTEFILDPFDGHYKILDQIGRGQFGVVHNCLHLMTQQTYAAKLLPLEVGRDHAQHELEMLSVLDHPNIVEMTSGYLTQQNFIIIFQKINGVNILRFFASRDNLTEHLAASCVEQILHALGYLHQQSIVHLSIKPENVLSAEVSDQSVPLIKLIHFERSRKLHSESNLILNRNQHSIEFEAPELLQEEPVTTVADMWSLGVLVYILLGGSSPFGVDSLDLTRDNIISNQYNFPIRAFKNVSPLAKEFITKLLVKDASKRLESMEAVKHSWLKQSKEPTEPTKLSVVRLITYLANQSWEDDPVR